MQETSEGKKPSKMDAFDRLQIHQGISDFITSVTNGYMFRQQWQLLCLYSLVNGGLRSKDYDTVRKEIIQVNLE